MDNTSVHLPEEHKKFSKRSKLLMVYDGIVLLICNLVIFAICSTPAAPVLSSVLAVQTLISFVCLFFFRHLLDVYKQIWRYGGSSGYLVLILSDSAAAVAFALLQLIPWKLSLPWQYAFFTIALSLLLTLLMRHLYQYAYDNASQKTKLGHWMRKIARLLAGHHPKSKNSSLRFNSANKINVAIIGAGRLGVMLAEELLKTPRSSYEPCFFVDVDAGKIGRKILGLPVLDKESATQKVFDSLRIQEAIFALPQKPLEEISALYEYYRGMGCKLKVYDFPMREAAAGERRQLREFDIEDLLFRKPLQFTDDKTSAFYKDKCVLISGGGGSIGSELCRQIAKMGPRQIVILDINENDTYTLQQKMRIAYGDKLDLRVEITTICDRDALDQIFAKYHPQIVLHAAAHKHVPLMEHNCCEAVKNNVFGTLNMVLAAEKAGVEKFIMISTDKAVNPTNVMGATKRMCEMIVQSRTSEKTKFSATRFGNVLGSNGSVIPLFKRQIRKGGPVTLTDKRIIRYFMTIPEASQLVLQSGAMAKNGELYVLDMGKPVKILDLAENMIRLSGFEPYKDIDIIETGLRPGEKLYEELLIKNEELDKTENKMIFIERDKPLAHEHINEKLAVLREALKAQDDDVVRQALMQVVPTYHDPSVVNADAISQINSQMNGTQATA